MRYELDAMIARALEDAARKIGSIPAAKEREVEIQALLPAFRDAMPYYEVDRQKPVPVPDWPPKHPVDLRISDGRDPVAAVIELKWLAGNAMYDHVRQRGVRWPVSTVAAVVYDLFFLASALRHERAQRSYMLVGAPLSAWAGVRWLSGRALDTEERQVLDLLSGGQLFDRHPYPRSEWWDVWWTEWCQAHPVGPDVPERIDLVPIASVALDTLDAGTWELRCVNINTPDGPLD